MSDVLANVRAVLKEIFNVDPRSVTLETKDIDVPGWDSVGHLSLCGALEDSFDIQFDVSQLADMNSVRTIVSIIEAKKPLRANGVSGVLIRMYVTRRKGSHEALPWIEGLSASRGCLAVILIMSTQRDTIKSLRGITKPRRLTRN